MTGHTHDTGISEISLSPAQSALRLHKQLEVVWQDDPGFVGKAASVSHNTIGLRFMITAGVFFAIGGVLSMLIRTQLATPAGAFLDNELYNQIFTMHGSVMMFLFSIPMLEGLAIWLLPKILGTRDLAYPRLTALGYWCYLFGGSIIVLSLLFGLAPDGGWFMYVPLTSKSYTPGVSADVWLLGVTFVEISAMAAAVEIIVSILRMRAVGMSLGQMPLMGWYLLGTAAMMLVGFPPLILGSILLELERAFDWPFFDVARGGDPLLWQHLFWLFGHPEVYIIFLPAAGAVTTILPVMCRTSILGYRYFVAAVLGLVFLSFGLWVHHMFTVGIPHMALAFFSAASTLVAVPTAVQFFLWVGTMWKGKPELHLPMLHLLGFFATFIMGGLTGVMLAIVPFNWQVHDTAFVTAHLHYVLVGGFVFPMMAALTYWMPRMTGRHRFKGVGESAFWIIFVGFHGTFLVMHATGLLGMPRRIASYPDNPEWILPNLISSIFGMVLSAGFALFLYDLVMQTLFGSYSKRNPWSADTLDWAMASPSPTYNFASLPRAGLMQANDALALAKGQGLLAGAVRGKREVLVVDAEGHAQHIAVLPGNTLLPFWTALSIGGFFVLMLTSLYWLTPLALATIVVMLWRWRLSAGGGDNSALIEVAPRMTLPTQAAVTETLALTGLRTFLVADATAFASLLFGVGFLTVVAPAWEAPQSIGTKSSAIIAVAMVLSALAGSCVMARFRLAKTAVLSNLLALGALAFLASFLGNPTALSHTALRGVLLGYLIVHVFIALLLAASAAGHRHGIPAWRLWQNYTFSITLIGAALVVLQELS